MLCLRRGPRRANGRKRRREQKEILFVYDNVIHHINGKKVLRANDESGEMNYKWFYDNCEAISLGQWREATKSPSLTGDLERFILALDQGEVARGESIKFDDAAEWVCERVIVEQGKDSSEWLRTLLIDSIKWLWEGRMLVSPHVHQIFPNIA